MALLRSMTGFARVRKLTPHGEMVFTIKSVNHRSLDVHIHLPADLDAYEHALRNVVKKRIARGHVDVRMSWNRVSSTSLLKLNRPLLDSWVNAFKEARATYGITSAPDLNAAFRIPGMLSEADSEPDESFEGVLSAALEETLDVFQESRETEGAALGRVIYEANTRIRENAGYMAELRDRVQPVFQQRLQEKLTALLSGAGVEPQRIIQEAAILADRSDITEEIHRLQIHSGQLDQLLDKGGDIGKKLDFLMQEMGRETNTILSKTSGAADIGLRITDLGVAIKSEIERIREQSLNLE